MAQTGETSRCNMAEGKGERCERLLNAAGTEHEPEQWVALVECVSVCQGINFRSCITRLLKKATSCIVYRVLSS